MSHVKHLYRGVGDAIEVDETADGRGKKKVVGKSLWNQETLKIDRDKKENEDVNCV